MTLSNLIFELIEQQRFINEVFAKTISIYAFTIALELWVESIRKNAMEAIRLR